MIRIAPLFLVLLCATAAQAGFSARQLSAVYAAPAANARLPLTEAFVDDSGRPYTLGEALGGRPAVVVFADYTCTTLCGPILAFAAAGLKETGLEPGRDFRLVVIGIDPKDTAAAAQSMKASHVQDAAIARATLMLMGTAADIDAATRAAGYHYVYDRGADQFAHPAVAYVVTAKGRIVRALSPLGLDAHDLRLALVDAGQGRIGNIADRIRLLCYCFDPATGVYSAAISRIMLSAGIFTVLALAGGVGVLHLATRRRTRA